jgi:hypothetical protein
MQVDACRVGLFRFCGSNESRGLTGARPIIARWCLFYFRLDRLWRALLRGVLDKWRLSIDARSLPNSFHLRLPPGKHGR